MLKPIEKKPIFEEVADQLLEQIQHGDLKEGERLPSEIELSQIFHVSRSSIREAIKSLQTIGVVTSRTGQGTFVSADASVQISRNQMNGMLQNNAYHDQILECRYIIESQAAYIFAQICSPEDIQNLLLSYEKLRKLREADDFDGCITAGYEFHTYIINHINNEFLITLYRTITSHINQTRSVIQHDAGAANSNYDHEHLEMIELFERHDANAARSLMEKHLSRHIHRLQLK